MLRSVTKLLCTQVLIIGIKSIQQPTQSHYSNYPQDTIVIAEEIENVHTEFVFSVILDSSSDM